MHEVLRAAQRALGEELPPGISFMSARAEPEFSAVMLIVRASGEREPYVRMVSLVECEDALIGVEAVMRGHVAALLHIATPHSITHGTRQK